MLKKQRVEAAIELKAKEQEINRLKAQLNVKDDEVRLDLNKKDDMIEMLQGKVQDLTEKKEEIAQKLLAD